MTTDSQGTEQQQLEARASEYVLGTLNGAQRAAFEEELRDSQDARAAVQLWEELLAELNQRVPAVEPPRSAFKQVMARIGLSTEKLVSKWRWLAGLGFATSFVFAALAAVQFFDPEAQQLRTELASKQASLVERDRRLTNQTQQHAAKERNLQTQINALVGQRNAKQNDIAALQQKVTQLNGTIAAKDAATTAARGQMQQVLAQLTTLQTQQAESNRFKPEFVSLVMSKEQLYWEIHADHQNGLVRVKRVATANPADGKDYALWVVRADGTVRPIGYISKIGKKVFELKSEDLDGLQAFAVSLEKENDELKNAPAGPVVYSGKANGYEI